MLIKHIPKKKILLLLGDMVIIGLAYFLSPLIRFGSLSFDVIQFSLSGILVLGIYLLSFYLADLYDTNSNFKSFRYLSKFLATVCIATVILAVLFFLSPSVRTGRGEFLINVILIGLFTYLWRLVFDWRFKSGLLRQKRLLIVGAGSAGRMLYESLKDNWSYKIVGFVDDDPAKWGQRYSCAVLGGCSVLKDIVSSQGVDAIIIAITNLKGPELLRCVLDCKMQGVDIYDMPSFYEELMGKVPIQHVDDFWLVSTPLSGVRKTVYTLKIKRVLDIILSIIGLLSSFPITILTAIAIKLELHGPVFYRQRRTGLNGETFDVIKFRSMTVNAEENGAVWAKKTDLRVTRVGKIIRKLRIDEIPQMWNVLKGEMSFIGPRPERPEFVSVLNEKIHYYSLRHSVRPGITGWAQVTYPYGASEEDALEKLQYDLFYIKNLSLLLDFHILLKTVKVVLWGRGAR